MTIMTFRAIVLFESGNSEYIEFDYNISTRYFHYDYLYKNAVKLSKQFLDIDQSYYGKRFWIMKIICLNNKGHVYIDKLISTLENNTLLGNNRFDLVTLSRLARMNYGHMMSMLRVLEKQGLLVLVPDRVQYDRSGYVEFHGRENYL